MAAGETLILSAGSLAFDGGHPFNASIASPDLCRGACMALPGCGAWVFCGNGMSGCGGGCKAYARAHPKREGLSLPLSVRLWSGLAARSSSGGRRPCAAGQWLQQRRTNTPKTLAHACTPPTPSPPVVAAGGFNADVTAPLPITSFGPYPFPHSSADGCHPTGFTGATSDAWPFGLCTLKRVDGGSGSDGLPVKDAAAGERRMGAIGQPGPVGSLPGGWLAGVGVGAALLPTNQPTNHHPKQPDPESGWVSGTIQVPEPCKGLSAASCAACLASQQPSECLACAKDRRAALDNGAAYVIKKGSEAQAGCAICSNVTAKAQRDM
jgi:hypothetical protein